MAELKTWDGDHWVTIADMDVTPELAALAASGQPLSPTEFMFAVLESARRKPRPLVCRYCGSTLVVYWDGVPLHAVWIECADTGDNEGNNACKASWQTDGKPLTDQKGTPIDD